MTKEEAKKFGLQLLHGIMERNESYPVYANNVKQAIDALSEESSSSEIPKDLLDAQVEIVEKLIGENNNDGANTAHPFACEYVVELLQKAVFAGAKWQADHAPLPEDTVLFNKGVEEGKRLMMEEAVEIGTTEICWVPDGDRVFPTFDPPAEDLLMPGIISQRFKDGDKVRVIVLPKED